ncbi:MAG: hypothetical protein R3C32_07390 [Chloroflexota bacterium]
MHRRTARRFGRRLAEVGLTLLGVAVLVFVTLVSCPGTASPRPGRRGGRHVGGADAALRAYYGMDQPLHLQFLLSWLGSVLTGNLGYDQDTGQSVLSDDLGAAHHVRARGAVDHQAFAIGIPLALPLGVEARRRP